MADLSVQNIVAAGIVPTYAAADTDGDRFLVRRGDFIHVKNGAGAPITVTLDTQKEIFGEDVDKEITVAATSERMIPVNVDRFKDADGYANISYSAVTTVTIAVLHLTGGRE